MIFLDSRYVDASIYKVWNAHKYQYDVSVTRQFPSYVTSYFTYEWSSTDRLDNLATRYLGDASLWWKILDLNPEIIDPAEIPLGAQLRIPHA
jgi:prophage DNA circulation protein